VSTFDFTPILLICASVITALWILRLVKVFNETPKTQPRLDRRIPTDELALTGPDYREPVADYFERRWESAVRTRAAVNHVCGIEFSPSTKEGAAVDPADPQATQRS
jgi:hypothetical protein